MSGAGLPVQAPCVSPETAPFWAAAAEGRLLLTVCARCDEYIWYPRLFCPRCGTLDIIWREASGGGSVYTFTVVHRTELPGFREAVPYVVAYVQLDEGPRVMTNIIGVEPDQVEIGLRVRVSFEDTGKGSALYRFTPERQGSRV